MFTATNTHSKGNAYIRLSPLKLHSYTMGSGPLVSGSRRSHCVFPSRLEPDVPPSSFRLVFSPVRSGTGRFFKKKGKKKRIL